MRTNSEIIIQPEGIITACHLTFAGPKGQMSDQNLVCSDILANEIIRTGLNVWQFLDWSDILSDHFRKVIIPSVQPLKIANNYMVQYVNLHLFN